MRYLVKRSIVNVLGKLWMPMCPAGTTITLRQYDIDNMRNDDGSIDRQAVSEWLDTNAGDFSSIIDFEASIEDGEKSINIDWKDEDNYCQWSDCMNHCEEEVS